MIFKPRTLTSTCSLSLILLLSNGCATVFNSKTQDVIVKTDDSKNEVYVEGEKQGSGRAVPVELERDMVAKQIKVEREGFEPEYYAFAQSKKSPLYIMSWIPFGLLLYPPFFDTGDKAQNYLKETPVYSCEIPYGERKEDDKYLFLNKTSFNVEAGHLVTTRIKLKDYYDGKYKQDVFPAGTAVSDESVNIKNTIFSDALNEILNERKFVDTTDMILKDITNTLYLEADITSLNIFTAYKSWMNTGLVTISFVDLGVSWKILDAYKQVILEKTETIRSGEFPGASWSLYGGNNSEDAKSFLFKTTQDALRRSLFKLIASKEYSEIRKIEDKKVDFEPLALSKKNLKKEVSDISSAMKASVTIKTDKSHGSGFFVSDDGYLITNFHVIANSETITIITNDQNEYEAEIIRENPFDDLALLKIKEKALAYFNVGKLKEANIGSDIFAIGTPSSMELTQTLSKGIISGMRKVGDNDIYQTDASINAGNSGGPMVSKDGEIIGVVNAKVVGKGVEGIGFSIPFKRAISGLNLK